MVDLLSHRIQTIAGNGEEGHSGDGGPSTEAQLDRPMEIFVVNDVLFIRDQCGSVLRSVEL